MANWKITTPSICWSIKKEQKDKEQERHKKTAARLYRQRNRARNMAKRHEATTDRRANELRQLVLKIKDLRKRKFKWREIDILIKKPRSATFYYRNKYLCEGEDGEVVREFLCAQCHAPVIVTSKVDRRRKFCSKICEKRYWRHRKNKN